MAGSLRWLSLAFVEYVTENGKVIIFDPWTKTDGNPHCPIETNEINQADLVLVSHDHTDHIGSASSICMQNSALIGGPTETMWRLIKEEGLNKDLVVNNGSGYLVGGGFELDWVKVVSTPAFHTSNTSCAIGTIIKTKSGTTLYHTGDTSLTMEMELYSRLYPLDVVILPVGGGGTMDALQAAEAVRIMNPKQVMPVHFEWNKNPEKALADFIKLCSERAPAVKIIHPLLNKNVKI